MTHRQHLLFTGAREDALARLPLLAVAPRLELSLDRISLVGPCARLDVAVLHACEERGEAPWLLLQLQFEGIEGREREATVAALRGDRCGDRTGERSRHAGSSLTARRPPLDRLH